MGNNLPLYQYIGDPVAVMPAQAYATDLLVSSASVTVAIAERKGVLFIANHSPVAGASVTAYIAYASNGVASDAVYGSDWTAGSNAVFGAFNSDDAAGCYQLDIDLSRVGLDNAGLFTIHAEVVGAPTMGIIAIPYGGNYGNPATNANAVVYVTS